MDGKFLFQKRLSLKGFFCLASYFLPERAMQNNFRKFEELVFCDLWFIPDSGFRFRIPVPDSGFRFPGFRVARRKPGRHFLLSCSEVNSTGYSEFGEPISPRV